MENTGLRSKRSVFTGSGPGLLSEVRGKSTELTPVSLKTELQLRILADHYAAHQFNILGSGWRTVKRGMSVDGFEGIAFSTDLQEAGEAVPGFYRETHARLREIITSLRPGYEPLDWQIDIKSGYRFDGLTHHTKLKYGVIDGVDAKVSADLGRLYQLIPLAKACRVFHDERYRSEAIAQILDFIAFNPPEYGAAWRANMNVAIRAANMVMALDILGWDTFDRELRMIFMQSLADHSAFIASHFEFPETNFHPNHFIANLAGLLVAAARLEREGFDGAAAWRKTALSHLSKEIVSQSFSEGANYECATAYHGLVLEMLAGCLAYAWRREKPDAGLSFVTWIQNNTGREACERLNKYFAAYGNLVQPDGLIPLIGDNDSGRFWYLEGDCLDGRDYRFLSLVGAALFDDPSLLVATFGDRHVEYAETLLGKPFSMKPPPSRQSHSFPQAGYHVMRDGDEHYMLINCGPVGTDGKGGHAHNDKLAFTLQLYGLDIFVDPGIYVYTASRYYRNHYRSTRSHNTVMIGDYEQNRWLENSPWWGVHDDTRCELLRWESSGEKDVFSGIHHGYERFADGAGHRRTITWGKPVNHIAILDEFPGATAKTPSVTCGFMLHPEVIITDLSDSRIVLRRGKITLTMNASEGRWETEPGFHSPNYGVKLHTRRVMLGANALNKITTVITYDLEK